MKKIYSDNSVGDYDRLLALQHEEEVQHHAAGLIQRCWRQYQHNQLPSESFDSRSFSLTIPAEKEVNSIHEEDSESDNQGSHKSLLETYSVLLNQREEVLFRLKELQRRIVPFFLKQRTARFNRDSRALHRLPPIARDDSKITGDTLPVLSVNRNLHADEMEAAYWNELYDLHQDRVEMEASDEASEAKIEECQRFFAHIVTEADQKEIVFLSHIKDLFQKSCPTHQKDQLIEEKYEDFCSKLKKLQIVLTDTLIQFHCQRRKLVKLKKENYRTGHRQDGFHIIDFERLKIENAGLNEKLKERSDDVLRLRKKSTTAIHVLSHSKETFEFAKVENAKLNRQVAQVEQELAALRDQLSQTKKRKDKYIQLVTRSKAKEPLGRNSILFLDYEERKQKIAELTKEIGNCEQKHKQALQWTKKRVPLLQTMQQILKKKDGL